MAANKFNQPLHNDPDVAARMVSAQERRQELEAGIIGKIFGNNPNTAVHIAGLVAILLCVIGGAYTFLPFVKPAEGAMSVAEVWKILVPVITGALGFIFGAHTKKG